MGRLHNFNSKKPIGKRDKAAFVAIVNKEVPTYVRTLYANHTSNYYRHKLYAVDMSLALRQSAVRRLRKELRAAGFYFSIYVKYPKATGSYWVLPSITIHLFGRFKPTPSGVKSDVNAIIRGW